MSKKVICKSANGIVVGDKVIANDGIRERYVSKFGIEASFLEGVLTVTEIYYWSQNLLQTTFFSFKEAESSSFGNFPVEEFHKATSQELEFIRKLEESKKAIQEGEVIKKRKMDKLREVLQYLLDGGKYYELIYTDDFSGNGRRLPKSVREVSFESLSYCKWHDTNVAIGNHPIEEFDTILTKDLDSLKNSALSLMNKIHLEEMSALDLVVK